MNRLLPALMIVFSGCWTFRQLDPPIERVPDAELDAAVDGGTPPDRDGSAMADASMPGEDMDPVNCIAEPFEFPTDSPGRASMEIRAPEMLDEIGFTVLQETTTDGDGVVGFVDGAGPKLAYFGMVDGNPSIPNLPFWDLTPDALARSSVVSIATGLTEQGTEFVWAIAHDGDCASIGAAGWYGGVDLSDARPIECSNPTANPNIWGLGFARGATTVSSISPSAPALVYFSSDPDRGLWAVQDPMGAGQPVSTAQWTAPPALQNATIKTTFADGMFIASDKADAELLFWAAPPPPSVTGPGAVSPGWPAARGSFSATAVAPSTYVALVRQDEVIEQWSLIYDSANGAWSQSVQLPSPVDTVGSVWVDVTSIDRGVVTHAWLRRDDGYTWTLNAYGWDGTLAQPELTTYPGCEARRDVEDRTILDSKVATQTRGDDLVAFIATHYETGGEHFVSVDGARFRNFYKSGP